MGGAAGGAHGTIIGAGVSNKQAARMTLEATEQELRERGIPVPPRPMSQTTIFWLGFLAGAAVISLPWWLFWELT